MTNLEEIRTLPVEQAAVLADCCLRQIEQSHRAAFVELGVIVLVSRERELWKHAPTSPKTFTSWLQECLPVSNGTAFAALNVAEKLADIPVEERMEMPRGNQERLAKMSGGLVRNDLGLRQAARQLQPSAFAEYVEREFPYEHIPTETLMRFRVSADAKPKVEEALMAVMDAYECNRDQAFSFICEAYLLDKSNVAKA